MKSAIDAIGEPDVGHMEIKVEHTHGDRRHPIKYFLLLVDVWLLNTPASKGISLHKDQNFEIETGERCHP